MKLTPAIKGGITGALMIIVSVLVFNAGLPSSSPIHYLVFAIFGGGIIWALIAYKNSAAFTGKFGDLFNQGFRTFIIPILMMAAFTFIFNKIHPEFARESAKAYKAELVKDKSKLPNEIDEEAKRYEKGYATALVYGSILGYLIIGAGVTAMASFTLTKRTS